MKKNDKQYVSWFSCGAASAVATKLAIELGYAPKIFYCEIKEEHSDNRRFLHDCEEWFGKEITVVGNDNFDRSADEVFNQTKFLVGPTGARCTLELKKKLRWKLSRPNDIIVMGYTVEEKNRLERLRKSEPVLQFAPVLIERNLTKRDCLSIIERAGIALPAMYQLGYKNNNCIGCVKGQAGYWNKIRQDFPDRFQQMAQIERKLGRKICKLEWRKDGKRFLKRIYLDELPPNAGSYQSEQDLDCGIHCMEAEASIQK